MAPTVVRYLGIPFPNRCAGRGLLSPAGPRVCLAEIEPCDSPDLVQAAPGTAPRLPAAEPCNCVLDARYKLTMTLLRDPAFVWPAETPLEEYRKIQKRPATGEYLELYDLKEDPYEFNNLAGRPGLKDVQERLSEDLQSWRAQTQDPLLDLAALRALVLKEKDAPPTPVPALTSLPADTGSNACPDTQPSLLMPGRQGRVSNLTPDPNRVRAEPDAQAEILGEIPAGAYFDVLEGPTCAADGAWFKVRYETLEGWMKEGSSTEYWVMPIYSEARTLTGPEIEVAGFAVTLPVEAGTTAQVQDAPFYPDENIPPVSLLRLPEYPLYNGSPSIYIYPVQDYLYYRADLRPRLEGIRTAVNRLIVDTRAISSLPEFCDAFLADQIYLLQVGRFAHGWGLRAVAITDDDENTPTYVFMGYSTDLSHLFYVRLPVRLMYGELAANVSPDDFMPSITQLDSLLQFSPWRPLPGLPDPSVAGACPGAPPFTLAVGDWARVSVVPPQTSRLRSTTGMAGTVVTEAQPGENLLVIDGPRCANGYTWWQVRTLEGLEGWAAEGDADSYWLVEPISVWYPLPTSLSTGSIQHYDLREINISASASLVNDISGSYSPASTPIPPPDNDETPMPEGSCASDFSATFCAEHSAYGNRGAGDADGDRRDHHT